MLKEEEYLLLRDISQRFRHPDGKINYSALARHTGYDRKTLRKYLARNVLPKIKPRNQKPSKLDEYKEIITKRLIEYPAISASRIYRELHEKGYTGGITIVRDYVSTIRPREEVLAVYRYETKPGVQAQVDWGDCGRVVIDGMSHHLYCFAFVLGYSRIKYIEFTLKTDVQTLLACHKHAFEYCNGIPQEILYDNIKQVILKRAIKPKDHEWNIHFKEFFTHYGFIARLCKPYRPQTKGKIENIVGYVKRDLLYGGSFQSFTNLNEQARTWMDRVNSTPHSTTNEIPFERFKVENLKSIAGIPPFSTSIMEPRKITRDAYISYLGNRYSVPYIYAGRNGQVRVEEGTLHITVGTTEVANHPVIPGNRRTSRCKEHFEGLLGIIMKQNTNRLQKAPRVLHFSEPVVENRPLSFYDSFSGGDRS